MSEDNQNKKYESLKIPGKQEQVSGIAQSSPNINAQTASSLSDEMFYEIEYDSGSVPGVGKYVLKPQKIKKPETDEIRNLFGQMRDIARTIRADCFTHRCTYDYRGFFDRRVHQSNAVIFYKQGMFMRDFTDDFAGNTQFSEYFPYYQMMGYGQLRTYFTWRTRVRQGLVTDTSLSYAFLYIYELLGNIGVANPQDGLNKLMFFWKAFSEHNKSIDKYILRWLKDYHIYYELPHSWGEFVKKNNLIEHYPKITEPDDSFDLFCSISKYNIKKSTFFAEELPPTGRELFGSKNKMITDCFSFVMDGIRRDFKTAGMSFDNALFRPTRKLMVWKPFKDALFYSPVKHPDKQIVINENEIYLCKNNEWTFSTIITTEKGRSFVGYVMKQMEAVLRKVTKYKYKITANTNMINEESLRILIKAGLFIDKIVSAAVLEFYREATKTVVRVDHASLARIRQEALITQEALIVEEQTQQKGIAPAPILFTAQDQNIFADATTDADEVHAPVSDIWESLKDVLSENELQALEVVLRGDDIKAFADECGIMTEVLIDGINEKAMDFIGDNLMDDDFVLYDDYKNPVSRMLTLERN